MDELNKYEWRDKMEHCFHGTMKECENWAKKCLEEGWVRDGVILSHPNHNQVLTLVHASQQ